MSQFKARFHQNYNYLQNNRWKNIIKKHIVGDFYFLNHSIENIITDRFTDEIITPNKKNTGNYSTNKSISDYKILPTE